MSAVLDAPVIAQDVEPLVAAVHNLDAVFSAWEESKDQLLSQDCEDAVNIVCALATSGFPRDNGLIDLHLKCVKLATAWSNALEGNLANDGQPLGDFFGAVAVLREQLRIDESPQDIEHRSVSEMLKEFGTSPKRWLWIAREYGFYDSKTDCWSGPFFTKLGQVLQGEIEREARNPGSVLKGFVPQSVQRRRDSARKQAEAALRQMQLGLFRPDDDVRIDPAPIIDLLIEGQFPDVIARVKRVPIDSVLEVAKQHGIKVTSREEQYASAGKLETLQNSKLTALRGGEEWDVDAVSSVPEPDPVDKDFIDPSLFDDDQDGDGDPDDQYLEETEDTPKIEKFVRVSGGDLVALVSRHLANDKALTKHQLMQLMVESGHQCTSKDLGEAIKTIQKGGR